MLYCRVLFTSQEYNECNEQPQVYLLGFQRENGHAKSSLMTVPSSPRKRLEIHQVQPIYLLDIALDSLYLEGVHECPSQPTHSTGNVQSRDRNFLIDRRNVPYRGFWLQREITSPPGACNCHSYTPSAKPYEWNVLPPITMIYF